MSNCRTLCRLGGALLLSFALLPPALAGEGEARLERFFDGLKQMRATFVQSLLDADKELLEESEGTMWLSRPGRFRIDYTKPYRQQYVADGERVWMYDIDLEQITVRTQDDTLGNAPALLLSGGEPVQKNFLIKELGAHEGFVWLELKPREKNANFEYVRLALEGDLVRAMEMVDAFAQTTRLYFTHIERNPALAADTFHFEPPPGVDVVGEAQ